MNRRGGLADDRRRLRFRAGAMLAGSLATLTLLLDRGGMGAIFAALAGLVALWIVLRLPRPHGSGRDKRSTIHSAGRAAMLAGMAVFCAAFGVAHFGEQRARVAALCEGQRAVVGGSTLQLRRVLPVAGKGFTAIEANISASRASSSPIVLVPRLPSYFATAPAIAAAARARLWTGDLTIALSAFDSARGCLALDATWRPFAVWAMVGGWLATLGALVMTLVSLGSLCWRARARERIAMRREDRPLPQGSCDAQVPSRPGRLLPGLAIGLALVLAALVVWPRAAPPSQPAYSGGPVLIAARHAVIDGPPNTDHWIVIADAMARRGRFFDAAEILLGAVESRPNGIEGWMALGDALYAHAGGVLTPAAALAYQRADRAAQRPIAAEAMERSDRPVLAREWRARSAFQESRQP